jgi:hypothetical protein|tara:strand:+ start:109 stop:267 length:159 start_codon:yes stop_codon:yes gene_type:complete
MPHPEMLGIIGLLVSAFAVALISTAIGSSHDADFGEGPAVDSGHVGDTHFGH